MSIFKNNIVVGITAALAATIIAPVLIPAIKRGSRPFAKFLVKGGVGLYESAREAVAGAGEMMEDVVAEVRAEKMGNAVPEASVDEEITPHAESARGNGASSAMPSAQDERAGPT